MALQRYQSHAQSKLHKFKAEGFQAIFSEQDPVQVQIKNMTEKHLHDLEMRKHFSN